MKALSIILIFFLPSITFGRTNAISVSPEQPVAGELVEINYDLEHRGSTLAAGEELFAGVNILLQPSFEFKQISIPLNYSEGRAKGSFRLPGESMQVTIYIYSTSTGSMDWNSFESPVFNKDGEAITGKFPGYPYRNKWFTYPFELGENIAKERIEKEMPEVEKFRNVDPAGTAFSMAYGYILCGDINKSISEIDFLLENYPGHQLTFQSLQSFNYQNYAGKINDSAAAARVNEKLLSMVKQNLDLPFARMFITSNGDKDLSIRDVEQLCRSWFNDEPLDAQPYMRLAARYAREELYPSKVIGLSNKGMELLMNPWSRVFIDLQGNMMPRLLSNFAYYKARALKQLGRPEEALLAATASNTLLNSANKHLFIGDLWFDWGKFGKAEKEWTEALKMGEGEARKKLEKIYNTRWLEDPFDAYIDSLLGVKTNKEPNKIQVKESPQKPEAPGFKVSTMDGINLDNSELKGKIIVLNFWSLGCGPCRAEMPDLNKLVEEYGNKGVVFIAFTPDKKQHVEEFLKKKTFDYQIVCEAHKVFGAYEANVQPTHVIIDKEGNLYHRMIGGGKKNAELLAGMLDILVR